MKLSTTFPKLLCLPLAAALFWSCRTPSRGSGLSASGPAQTRPTWIKSPEAIEGTIIQAWGIQISEDDRWKYLQSMYSMLGGTLVLNLRSLVDQPNELFLLGLDNLSGWLSVKLVEKQGSSEATGKEHSFDGLGLSDDDAESCFKDDAKDWCDFKDGVTLTSLSQAGVDASGLSKEWRKRLMHNVQDIGEFMLLAIDNTLKVPAQGDMHAAQFLIDKVFLPALGDGPVTAEREAAAWRSVIYTVLMSGGFYLEAPVESGV